MSNLYKMVTVDDLDAMLKALFPNKDIKPITNYSSAYKSEGVRIELRRTSYGYYSFSRREGYDYIDLSIEGSNYRSIKRRINIKDRQVDSDKFMAKFQELSSLNIVESEKLKTIQAERNARSDKEAELAKILGISRTGVHIYTHDNEYKVILYLTEEQIHKVAEVLK